MAVLAVPKRLRDHQPGEPSRPLGFRRDIDGLRAVAVVLVVAFHARIPGFSGGFVGVDVFFVISGFLITRGLVDQHQRTGRIDLIDFWLRRARRLLPAASTMIVLVVLAQLAVRSPLFWDDAIAEGLAASTYWSNELLSQISGGYFGARAEDRALLHTWSLSVEEQFYIGWPVVLAIGAGSGIASSRRLFTVMSVVALLSILVSVQLTSLGEAGAYYAAFSRAWEFSAGALLAVGWNWLSPKPNTRWLGPIGFIVILAAATALGNGQPFPWPWAAPVVLGTMAVIVAQPKASSILGRALAAEPVQFFGRLSYSWYLWHWPVLVLGIGVLGNGGLVVRIGLVVLSLGPAMLSQRWVETPLRRRTPGTRRQEVVRSLLAPLAISLLVLGGAKMFADDVLSDPFVAAIKTASEDYPRHLGGCYSIEVSGFEQRCVFGDSDGEKLILVIGDSHAAHWMPAFGVVGERHGVRAVAVQIGNCPIAVAASVGGDTPECNRLRSELGAIITTLDPDVVAVTSADVYAEFADVETWRSGHEALARALAADGIEMLLLHDLPRYPFDPLTCLIDAGPDEDCGLDRDQVDSRSASIRQAEAEALERAGHGEVFDPVPFFCNAERCAPMTDDGRVIMQDSHHMTGRYSADLADAIEPILVELLERWID
jgi:peptidoglycan/LPS O-acetylase OafA/YrhL